MRRQGGDSEETGRRQGGDSEETLRRQELGEETGVVRRPGTQREELIARLQKSFLHTLTIVVLYC